ncbi:hypothetical protein A3A49_00480 [Candidatus Curtissbacteria bacterium RIFCSPLOWO2_01_FULL_38_11b]|uniref:Thymidylate synthase n=1 Tax=Candidatus Curtissbacteria bacterium RIFCSPLOWO2_01_FULL_38_11b TaxID=1797725 RepID=A0A1F5H300_9BACT|nr:MAG: hypothetical protein A3A49_00480 [Candidatus Curtissbacteria bacterium RIFCSPLOWO2_01_FULL_38_11b]
MKDQFKSFEKFTREETYFISPFFTNLDRNIFAAFYLPSEVLGALASRYSRSTKGVRRLFFDEYIRPILEPDLEGVDKKSVREAETMRKELLSLVDYLHKHGGWETVVNSRRARDFFAKWLAAYGDDSIAQMAGAHIFCENISQVAVKTLEDFRIGFAPLEKSTRYVAFDKKVNGRWPYFIEPDLLKLKSGASYKKHMNMLFDKYAAFFPRLFKFFEKNYPKENDQSERAYLSTINAKTCDVLRTYLPAATLTNVGFFGVGQAFEYVITKCLASPLSEIRSIAKEIQRELNKVIPSMVGRATSERGKIYQRYVRSTDRDLEKLAYRSLVEVKPHMRYNLENPLVDLVEWDSDAEDKIVASLLYKYARISYSQIKESVSQLTPSEKLSIIKKAVAKRQVRQHRIVRAFENTYYKFDIVANFGAYRDLHRHRMQTQERQRFTTELGYDVPAELKEAKMDKPYVEASQMIDRLYRKMKPVMPNQAQYVVMMGHKIRWYQWQNLRELCWEAELRTGPQGHLDYRKIEQEKVSLVKKVHPTLVEALKFVDFRSYDLARRESEKRIDKKLGLMKLRG